MKKILYFALLFIGCVATSCERTTYLAVEPTVLDLKVGDSAMLHTYNVDDIIIYSVWNNDFHHSTDTVCTLSSDRGKQVTVYAVHAGEDTISVQYSYTLGIFAYGDEVRVPVHVTE